MISFTFNELRHSKEKEILFKKFPPSPSRYSFLPL